MTASDRLISVIGKAVLILWIVLPALIFSEKTCLSLASECGASRAAPDIEPSPGSGKPELVSSRLLDPLHLELTGRYSSRNLRETFSLVPSLTRAAFDDPSRPWSRKWSDWKAYATISCDVADRDWLLLRPGIHLGMSQGEASFIDLSNGFSEFWGTKGAFLWGACAVGEIRNSKSSGPFARLTYNFFQAGSSEDWERIASGLFRNNSNPDERDARFEWLEHKASLAFGWRWGTLSPMAGVSYSYFQLKKWLGYHISEANAATPPDLELIRAQNSMESRYRYRNDTPLAPFISLEWRAHPNLTILAGANVAGDEDYNLNIVWNF